MGVALRITCSWCTPSEFAGWHGTREVVLHQKTSRQTITTQSPYTWSNIRDVRVCVGIYRAFVWWWLLSVGKEAIMSSKQKRHRSPSPALSTVTASVIV
jgi:hypothetical protein